MSNQGFSLLELVVVLIVAAVLTGLALPYYFNAVERARTVEVVSLWGRTKNWASGQSLSQEQADRFTKRLEKAKLRYFTGQVICREKENANEICWEAEFTQKKEDSHARYKLVTTHNFMNLVCIPLNNAGEDFCVSFAQDENAPEQIGDEKGYTFY